MKMQQIKGYAAHRLTQHKSFAISHPNYCFAKNSFILESLAEMPIKDIERRK